MKHPAQHQDVPPRTAPAPTALTGTSQQAKSAFQNDDWVTAERLCRLTLQETPEDFDALNVLGMIAAQTQRPHEAIELLKSAIAIQPNRVEAHGNLANVLHDLDRHEEALERFERAIRIKPEHAQLHCNRGIVLCDLGRHNEALECYERAIRIETEYVEARWNIALLHLQLGHFAQGWHGHELRWKVARKKSDIPVFSQPLWLGDASLAGKTILLHGEAGLGDSLQFCRYVRQVAELGAETIVAVPPSLVPLLGSLEGAAQVMAVGAPLPTIHYHCPLMSLGLAFNTTLNSIPTHIPYLRCDAARTALWQQRLGKAKTLRAGLVWSGNANHKNDRNRSLTFKQVLPLLNVQVEWICLQKEIRDCDREALVSRHDIRQFSEHLTDFADTAALVDLMDVVVTVDTSIAHLAGAMGKPVWILLPYNPDWRWLLDRQDSPWYPTARLFRQSHVGDWQGAIQNVREALTQEHLKFCNAMRSTASRVVDSISAPQCEPESAGANGKSPGPSGSGGRIRLLLRIALACIIAILFYFIIRLPNLK